MSKTISDTEAAAAGDATAQEPTSDSNAYFTLAALRKGCRTLFGVSVSTFDGGTCGLDANGRYTADEVGQKIKDWKERSAR